MEVNGFILFMEELILKMPQGGIFGLCIIVLLLSSLLSGLLDNAPVTVLFIPILEIIIVNEIDPNARIPLIIALILGVNLGGNFLPQGSAADMMTLELSLKNHVRGLNYKVLTKIGGLFALLHIFLGIGYLAFIIYVVI